MSEVTELLMKICSGCPKWFDGHVYLLPAAFLRHNIFTHLIPNAKFYTSLVITRGLFINVFQPSQRASESIIYFLIIYCSTVAVLNGFFAEAHLPGRWAG
jgi:hypothetical protein